MRIAEFGSGDCPAKSWDVGEPNHNTRDIRVGRPKAQSPSARSGIQVACAALRHLYESN
jgi:hypothetical protein